MDSEYHSASELHDRTAGLRSSDGSWISSLDIDAASFQAAVHVICGMGDSTNLRCKSGIGVATI